MNTPSGFGKHFYFAMPSLSLEQKKILFTTSKNGVAFRSVQMDPAQIENSKMRKRKLSLLAVSD